MEDVDEPPAFGYALCHVRIFDNGLAEATTSALRGLRVYHETEAASEDHILIQARRSSTFRMPAVIVERARPLMVNPMFAKEGYRYGRVHFNPAMRSGMKVRLRLFIGAWLPSLILHPCCGQASDRSLLSQPSSSCAGASSRVTSTATTIPIKDMILFRDRGMSRSASPGPSRARVAAHAPMSTSATDTSPVTGGQRTIANVMPRARQAGERPQHQHLEGEVIDLTLSDSD